MKIKFRKSPVSFSGKSPRWRLRGGIASCLIPPTSIHIWPRRRNQTWPKEPKQGWQGLASPNRLGASGFKQTKLPVFYREYEGREHDSKLFAAVLGDIRANPTDLVGEMTDLTVVVDKGMNSSTTCPFSVNPTDFISLRHTPLVFRLTS